MIETDILLKPVPDLPVSNSSSFDIVAVVNNKDTVRVGWESLTANYIKQTRDVPLVPGESSDSPYITFAADDTGLYVSDGSSWRKMATYGDNWDDLQSSDTRFLPVNSTITLSEEERVNVFSSLQLGNATLEVAGLVKVSTDPEDTVNIDADGVLHVNMATPILETNPDGKPGVVYIKDFYDGFDENDSSDISSKCAVTERYVHQAIQNSNVDIPRATYTEAGIVQIDINSALTVDDAGILSVRAATADVEGVLRIQSAENESAPVAASLGVVNNLINNKASEILARKATASQLGLVKVPGLSSVTVNDAGELNVRYATSTEHGTVVAMEEIVPDTDYSSYTSTAVTPGAVVNYVTERLDTLNETFPVASATTLGVIRVGAGLRVDEDGLLSLDNATESRLGGVTVDIATNDSAPSTVPTVARVIEMVDGKVINFTDATTTEPGVVKLGRGPENPILDGAPVGVNAAGQLYIDSSVTSPNLATSTEAGIVQLSSSSTGLSATAQSYPGLSIGMGAGGAIYVDAGASSNRATTSRPGLVKLSVASDTILPSSNPGIGVDAQGRLRVDATSVGGGSSSSSGNWIVNGTSYNDATANGYASVEYYEDSNYKYPIVRAATESSLGVVMLSAKEKVSSNSIPIGVDESGKLRADFEIDGGGTLGAATTDALGLVKLGTSSTISSGWPVGVDSNGRLYVSASSVSGSLNIPAASTSTLGGVYLSTPDIISSASAVIGRNSSGKIVVRAADASNYGAVKLGEDIYNDTDSYKLVGRTSDGRLAIGTDSSDEVISTSPFSVALTKVSGGSYKVTMTGGVIQMNDGSLINVEPITAADNMSINPSSGQVLQLQVYTNSAGEAVAKLKLVDTINVLTCKPSLG